MYAKCHHQELVEISLKKIKTIVTQLKTHKSKTSQGMRYSSNREIYNIHHVDEDHQKEKEARVYYDLVPFHQTLLCIFIMHTSFYINNNHQTLSH